MAEDDPFKGAGRAEDDPFKGAGRAEDDPFKGAGRTEDDPLKGAGRGLGGSLSGGGGLVVVAFIGTACMDVGQLACRMLTGSSAQTRGGGGSQVKAVERFAMLAQNEGRKRAIARDKIERLARDQVALLTSQDKWPPQ
jgi:hypothetical protein